jgi:plasmid stabilization system protein ParE
MVEILRNPNPDIHPEAQAEYENSLLYYAACGYTLTTLESFRTEIEAAFAKIAANPLAYRLVKKTGKQRRFGPTKTFRFVIYYVVKNDGRTTVLAVAHPSRKPAYWTYRA